MSLSKHDYDLYKSNVEKMVYKYLSRDRTSAASIITHTVDSGSDKRKLEEKLAGYMDKALAHKLSDKAFSLVDQLGIKLKTRKRTHKADDEEQNVPPTESRDAKKPRTEEVPSNTTSTDVPLVMHQKQIQDIMAKAQAAIEKRKRALSSLKPAEAPPSAAAPASNGTSKLPPALSTVSSSVNSRIAELQARIRSQMSAVPSAAAMAQTGGALPPPQLLPMTPTIPTLSVPNPPIVIQKPAERPPPIILDSEGRTLDLSGKEVHITSRVPTLKANIRAKKREQFKTQLNDKPLPEELPENEFFDTRVKQKSAVKPKRMVFSFHDKGKFVQLAQRERAKSRLEKLQSAIVSAARKTGISTAARIAQIENDSMGPEDILQDVPDIEWWDSLILETNTYPEDDNFTVRSEYITNLVEHPLEMKCPSDSNKPVDLKVFLTAKERKKLRRMNRRETWKEKQDKIRLGLEPPPEPKVRMANLMRVLGTEAVLDPTKMEKHVRDQMAKRLKAHEDANAARKLTPQQRKEKRVNKLKEDTSTGVNVSVYRVTDLSNGSHKFKVETNAKQLFLTGVVLLFKDINVVVVEGGPKQQKKYKQLMLNRIKWVEEARTNTKSDVQPSCQLVWEGKVLERTFGEVQFKSCPSESFAREFFRKNGVEHYWDLSYGKKLTEEAEEGQL